MGFWRLQVIPWTNVNISSVMFWSIHLNAILQWVPKVLFCVMSLKNYTLKIIVISSRGQWVNIRAWKLLHPLNNNNVCQHPPRIWYLRGKQCPNNTWNTKEINTWRIKTLQTMHLAGKQCSIILRNKRRLKNGGIRLIQPTSYTGSLVSHNTKVFM